MLRLNPERHLRFIQADKFVNGIAGSEANVAADLRFWGFQTRYFTALPDNEIGDSIVRQLKQNDVDCQFVERLPNSRVGILFIEKGSNQRPSKVIYDREHTAFQKIVDTHVDWDALFEDITHFHFSGITLGLSEEMALFTLEVLKKVKNKGIKISFDLNYRANLWQYTQDPQKYVIPLLEYVDILIGNEEDISKMLSIGIPDGSEESFKSVCREIFETFPSVKIIAQSLRDSLSADRNGWSGQLADRDNVYRSSKFEISDIVDRVGGGDSFAAGLIAGLHLYDSYQKSLDFAVCASCLKHSIEGDFCLVSLNEIESLRAGNSKGRIIR